MHSHKCRAVLVSGTASGQGKTTVTAALARQARARGERVRVFKTGPDFLDPTILERASGAPVYQLDLFMGGASHCRALLAKAAREADLILVEGAMGLFDGTPSSADLAQSFGLSVVAVIDGSAMAQTFAAIAYGLAHFRPGLDLVGVVANRVGGAVHARMLSESLPARISTFAWLPRDERMALPERHLGLFAASELDDLDERIDRVANALHGQAMSLPSLRIEQEHCDAIPRLLDGCRIAVARDNAFSFIYPANLDVLHALGAELTFFSPLDDTALPDCDALWLPGGYPELHVRKLALNQSMRAMLHAHHEDGKPLLAECGGMMSLFDEIELCDGSRHTGFGLLPGRTRMHQHFTALGLQSVRLPEGDLRGHSFHCSSCETPLAPIARGENPNGGPTQEVVYRLDRITASYIHFYFPSNPGAIASVLAGAKPAQRPSKSAIS